MEPTTDRSKTSKKPLFAVGGVAALAVAAWMAFGFFGIQTAFIDEAVDEGGPVFASVGTSETAADSAESAAEPPADSSATTEDTVADQAAEPTTTAGEPTTTAAPATTEQPVAPDPSTTTTEQPAVADPSTTTTEELAAADPSTTTTEQPAVADATTTTTEQAAVADATTTTSAPTTTVAPTTTTAAPTTTTAAPTTTTAAPTTTTSPAEPGEVVTTHRGNFSGSTRYDVAGEASVLGNGTSQRFVRFEGFESSNGPDLKVYLRAASGDFVNLGNLKGNVGAQNYEIPADVDLDEFRTVEIWCDRFSVGFGSAQLAPT